VLQHGFERGERPVVHVGCGELDVAQGGRAESKLVELLVDELPTSEVERRAASCSGAELRHPGVGEVSTTQQRPAVAAGAAGPVTEEEQGTPLLLGRQCGVIVLEIAIER